MEKTPCARNGGHNAMDVQRLFAELDLANDGVISSVELTCGMLSRGMDPDDISALFRALDTDGDGTVVCPGRDKNRQQPFSCCRSHQPQRVGSRNWAPCKHTGRAGEAGSTAPIVFQPHRYVCRQPPPSIALIDKSDCYGREKPLGGVR